MNQRELFFAYMGLPSADPLAIEVERAEGIYIYDKNGNQYLDLCSGVSVSNLGHNNQRILQAIENQIHKYLHLMVYGELIQSPQVKLAELLIKNLPENLESVYFVNSGSEATEGALKLAKRFTGRTEIIAFKNAYHGSTHGALSVLGFEDMKRAFRPLLPDIRFLEFNNENDLQQITEKTACVIVEPVQAEAGVILPQNDFLKKLRKRCDETGCLLIFDEVQTGLGRTGKLFAFEHFDVVPDILTLAKAFGGGMPIGAFISSRKIMQTLQFKPQLGHITTFGGHPVSAAAALESLKIILETRIFETAHQKGLKFKQVIEKHPLVKDIRGIGLLWAVELENPALAAKFIELAKNETFLITDRFLFRPNAFRIGPPLTITDQEIDDATDRILRTLDLLKNHSAV